MLPDKQTNSNPAKQSSTFMGTLQDKLKDIKNFSNWSAKEQMVAVTAVGVIFSALLPAVAVALPVAATGAAVALTLFFAVKAVEYGYKGLKWSAEKTWEGAKYTAGKIKAGAVYAKDLVKEGHKNSVDLLKRGAHLVNKRTRKKASNVLTAAADKLYRAAGNENYSDKIDNELIPDSPQKNKIQEIKENLKAILVDGEDNTKLFESIRLGISSKIGEKIARDYLPNEQVDRWKKQKNFVDNLDANGLRNLVGKRLSDKSKYFRDSIFSEHHSEIKEIIEERKTCNLSRSSSTDSLNSASSTVRLLTWEYKEVKAPISLWNRLSSPFKSSKKSEQPSGAGYQPLSEPNTMPSATVNHTNLSRSPSSSSLYDGSPVPTPEAPESPTSSRDSGINSPNPSGSSTPPKLFKPPVPPKPLAVNLAEANKRKKQQTPSTSRSDFSDSGINSDSSTPTGRQSPAHMMLTEKDGSMKKQAHLKKTARLDELVGQPSTEIDVDTDVQHQTAPNFVA